MPYDVKSPLLQASTDSIALLPMGASQSNLKLYPSPSAQSGEGSRGVPRVDGTDSDTDSLLDTFDLEAQMAQERLSRRAKQLRAKSSLLLQLPSRAADVGQAFQRGGLAIKNHLRDYGDDYGVGIVLVSFIGGILFGIVKLLGPSSDNDSTPPLPDGASASALGAQITATLSRL